MRSGVEVRVLTVFFAFFLLSAASAPASAAPAPKITDIGGTVREKVANVHFSLENGFPPEMVEALKSGIEISFRVTVEVERVYRNWFNQTVGEIRYTQSIRYDVLSRAYRLRAGSDNEILPDVHAALERMTRFTVRVPIYGEITGGKHYRALVRVRLDRVGLSEPLRSIVFFSSLWDVETDWAHGRLAAP
ncbi:MAG: DUF4390 domain-containing protein [Verrucomicrobiota bacterium]